MVIRWFIGLVLLCLSLVAQGRAYTYEAINEQSRSSKEYSLNTQDLAKNTKSQAYINNIIDEFQEGSPIPQYITACMGNVHEQQLENAGYELRDLPFDCIKGAGSKFVGIVLGKAAGKTFELFKAKINGDPVLFMAKLKDLGVELKDEHIASIQKTFGLNFDLKLKISQLSFDLGQYTNLKKAYTGFQSQLGSGYTTFENALKKCNNDVLTAFDNNTALFNKLGNIKELGETELAERMAKVSKGEDFGQLKVGNNLVGVQGAGNFAKYTKVDGWLKGITNATSRANVENIIKNWSDDILISLNSKIDLFPGLQAEFVANNQLLHHFNSLETTWWSKYALGGLAKRTNSILPATFKQMVGEIEVTSLGQKLKLKTVSLDETSASYIGKLFDETVETRMVNAWKTNNFSDLPSSVSTQLQTLKNQGYELVVEAQLSIGGKNPVPDYLLIKKEIDPLTNAITYDLNNAKYIDCKYLWDSPFTTSQVEIVNGVTNNGVANTIAPAGLINVNGFKFVPNNSSVKIKTVEKLTVNQQLEMVIQ